MKFDFFNYYCELKKVKSKEDAYWYTDTEDEHRITRIGLFKIHNIEYDLWCHQIIFGKYCFTWANMKT